MIPDAGTEVRAQLDHSSGAIIMPFSEYDFYDNEADIALLNRVYRIYIGRCMSEMNLPYAAATMDDDLRRVVDSRLYGIWWEQGAQQRGFAYEPSAVDAQLESDRATYGESWIQAEAQCFEDATTDEQISKFVPSPAEMNDSLVARLKSEAYLLASANEIWQSAREEWWECLRSNGLQPLTGANEWGSLEGSNSGLDLEGSIRIATIEAKCNNETSLTQTLADLEASYQQDLIVQNQAALNEWKERKQVFLDGAREYVALYG